MLKDYNVDNFSGKRELALLCMRQSIWNRRVRDYLMPDAYYRTYESFEEMTGGKHSLIVETTHRILNSSSRSAGDEGEKDVHAKAARWLCDAMDFRELCRIFGERFAAVNAFEIRSEYDFSCRKGGRVKAANAGNVLSYMRVEITCERAYESDRTAFYELVRYRGGDNFDLFWDSFPDIDHTFSDGRAKGCNVFMRGLTVYDIQSDGIPAGVRFGGILPVVIAFSRIAASQFDYIIPVEERIPERSCNSGERCIWVSPEGEVRYTSVEEGLDIWGKTLGIEGRCTDALAGAVIAAAPGETLLVPERYFCEQHKGFLEMQKAVLKNTVHL